MESTNERRTVLLTGFGAFQKYKVNPSWEAVHLCVKLCEDLEANYNVKIIGKEIPVAYEEVSNLVEQLWEEHKPMFVIHVGVSTHETLRIESTAHGSGYISPDINSKLPDENQLENGVFQTSLDIKDLCQSLNDHSEEICCKAEVSHNAGRYLCEYIFYKSLSIDPTRVLFIHVPDVSIYKTKYTAQGLRYIIEYLLQSTNPQPSSAINDSNSTAPEVGDSTENLQSTNPQPSLTINDPNSTAPEVEDSMENLPENVQTSLEN